MTWFGAQINPQNKILSFILELHMYPASQKVLRTDAATHAVPAWKMSTQGKTGRKKKS